MEDAFIAQFSVLVLLLSWTNEHTFLSPIFHFLHAKSLPVILTQFQSSASEVIETSNENVRRVFTALESLSLTTTTFILQEQLEQQEQIAQNNISAFPPGFVTIPDVEYHFGHTREVTRALVLGYVPVVEGEDFDKWAQYAEINKGWMVDAYKAYPTGGTQVEAAGSDAGEFNATAPYIWDLHLLDEDGDEIVYNSSSCGTRQRSVVSEINRVPEDPAHGDASPLWLLSPAPNPKLPSRGNYNMRSDPVFRSAVEVIDEHRTPTFRDICAVTNVRVVMSCVIRAEHEMKIDSVLLLQMQSFPHVRLLMNVLLLLLRFLLSKWFDPQAPPDKVDTIVVVPVFESFEAGAPIAGHLFAIVPWVVYFQEKRSTGTEPVIAVVTSSCGHAFTFEIHDHSPILLAESDIHDPTYEDMAESGPLGEYTQDSCHFTLTVYPTAEYEDSYTSNNPLYYMLVVLAIFTCTSLAFLIFDHLVQKRQRTLVTTAQKQNALVSSLFPKSIQKKLMADLEEQIDLNDVAKGKPKWNKSGTAGLRSYLNAGGMPDEMGPEASSQSIDRSKPIADLFPETTIMFADIAGFTAWSSTREPSQVFTLLESIYHEFDVIAKRRRVFKVEVVGDCYVAVCGLPDPRRDHAVVMAKFASECLSQMYNITRKLEVELGPDTTELGLRIGIHSGPVVAGVLRGDKSRFQLFGDTMNTTARMESTGIPNRIQISQETANLLLAAGKDKWVTLRENKVEAKGKGELTTYWLNLSDSVKRSESVGSSSGSVTDGSEVDEVALMADLAAQEAKRNRVAEWTVEVMASVLRTMARSRNARKVKKDPPSKLEQLEQESLSHSTEATVIEEVAPYIILPDYKMNDKTMLDEDEVILEKNVREELRSYVQTIAGLYNDNPFHNFDHANHVVMSVNKLLSRINAPDLNANNKELHDHTYGINSDPLTWFAVAFAALIHDVDHSGVPNSQLVKEGAPVAELYHNKSVAEQNSFDIAWDLLMEPAYKNLRGAIYVTSGEFRRFRQLVINTVMATDIIDKDLKEMQNRRWQQAFDGSLEPDETDGPRSATLKATIVIEHLIQASDVSHTMQHWHVYRRWNEKFFQECYRAYKQGRAAQNPADTWYEGEKGFFDFYIIPLAKKLKECGVFGVSSDEYLSYATQNRQEWEERGKELVATMVAAADALEMATRGTTKMDSGSFH
jgi:class 3 adenylate cyclase